MKKIVNALIFIAILVLIFGISFFVADKFNLVLSPIFSFYTAFLILFGLLGISYNNLWSSKAYKKRPFISSFIIVFILVILYYFSKVSLQVYPIYKHMASTEGKHWTGNVFQADPVLGHKPVECLSGTLNMTFNHTLIHNTPIKFDENGFRIPVETACNRSFNRPLILFLGDSFTEGADCNAEKTFSAIVGDSIHGTSINAGVSSYGFSQMLLLARTLIPKYKPDYVVVQNSPWLSERAINRYAPTFGLAIPCPYFANVNGIVQIVPPAFSTSCFSLNWKYDSTRSKLRNFITFYFKEGFAVCARDWLNIFLAKYRTPKPEPDHQVSDKLFFDEILQITNSNNSNLIVLNLGEIGTTGNTHAILGGKNVKFAEADSVLWNDVNFKEKTFQQLYYYWGWTGKDSVILDKHPSLIAHAAIAQSIIQKIKN